MHPLATSHALYLVIFPSLSLFLTKTHLFVSGIAWSRESTSFQVCFSCSCCSSAQIVCSHSGQSGESFASLGYGTHLQLQPYLSFWQILLPFLGHYHLCKDSLDIDSLHVYLVFFEKYLYLLAL